MVGFGKALPDEIFIWMIDELCQEPSNVLQISYSNILRASTEQVGRLVVPGVIQKMFQDLGGTAAATTVSEVIHPVQKTSDPYNGRDWTRLCSVVKFLGQASKSLKEQPRIHALCMLLRLAVDRVVSANVDLYDRVQDTTFRLCRSVPNDSWDSFVSSYLSSYRFLLINLVSGYM